MKRLVILISIYLLSSIFVYCQIPHNFFVKNYGQWPSNVLFTSFQKNLTFFATNEGLFFDYFKTQNHEGQFIKSGSIIKFKIDGAKFSNIFEKGISKWKLNFFYGNNPSNWKKEIRGAEQIIIPNILDKIDLVLTSSPDVRYDFVVHPGGNPQQIKINIEGATIVKCSEKEIILKTSFGEVIHRNLLVFQKNGNEATPIEASFKIIDNHTFGFIVSNYDKSKELIIDPLVLSALIGGSNAEEIVDICEPVQGTIIVTGWTESPNFSTTTGAYSRTLSGGKDIFISKFIVKGSARELVFSTFLGGAENDSPVNVQVDQNSNIYIGATTNSNDLPLVNAISKSSYGLNDAYICKLNSDCNEIIFSTYFGGSKDDFLTSIKLSGDNGIYLCGYTSSNDLPTTGGAYQDKLKGKYDIFFAKLSNTGQTIRTCTYIGGIEDDFAYDMCVTPSEYIYIGGATKSNDFPAFPVKIWYYGSYEYVFESPFDRTYNGNFDGVVIKILGSSGALEYASFFGGLADDFVTAVGYFGADEKVVFAGKTYKEPSVTTFPLSQTAYQNTIKGQAETFVASLSNIVITTQYNYTYKSQNLVFSTFLGGSGDDIPTAVTFNKSTQTFYLVGYTNSTNFPIVNNPSSKKQQKNDIYFVSMLNDGSAITYSNIIGGNNDDIPTALFLNYAGDYYIVGSTNSTNFPIVNPISGISGESLPDAFILKNVDATIRFEAPFANDKFCPEANVTVKWGVEGMTQPDSFDIEIMPECTSQWMLVASNVNGLSKTITLPKDITGKVWIRVSHPKGLIATIAGPIIIQEPPKLVSFYPSENNIELCEGDSIYFFVEATGDGLRYQWYYDGTPISNATDSILVLKNLTTSNSGKYKVGISGTCPPLVESPEISLTVIPETKITNQSKDTIVKEGKELSLFVQSKGQNLKYQWYKNDIKLLGETRPNFNIQSVSRFDEGYYYCIVEGTCGRDTSRKIFVSIDTNITKVEEMLNNNCFSAKVIDKTLYIWLRCHYDDNPIGIYIYNILGENVITEELPLHLPEQVFKFDLTKLSVGIYLLNIRSKDSVCNIPFFLQ
ncbi:MAG: immunoglobulin domain-containing protein [Bacteroidota bacterium]